MEEKLISFETANLAKEKGFNIPTLHYYFEYGVLIENELKETTGMDYGSEFTVEFSQLTENWNDGWLTKKNGDRCFGCSKSNGYFETFSAPIQSLLQRWLRETHNIDCNVVPVRFTGYLEVGYYTYAVKSIQPTKNYRFKTWEEALEICLQEALKLI